MQFEQRPRTCAERGALAVGGQFGQAERGGIEAAHAVEVTNDKLHTVDLDRGIAGGHVGLPMMRSRGRAARGRDGQARSSRSEGLVRHA